MYVLKLLGTIKNVGDLEPLNPVGICCVTVYISRSKDSNYLLILWYFFQLFYYIFLMKLINTIFKHCFTSRYDVYFTNQWQKQCNYKVFSIGAFSLNKKWIFKQVLYKPRKNVFIFSLNNLISRSNIKGEINMENSKTILR